MVCASGLYYFMVIDAVNAINLSLSACSSIYAVNPQLYQLTTSINTVNAINLPTRH